MDPAILQGFAEIFTERMLNGVMESAALAGLVWAFLKLTGLRSSSTRFVAWFVVLLAVVVSPFMGLFSVGVFSARGTSSGASFAKSAILLPASWAGFAFLIWGAIVTISLGRVVLGLWQIRRLRKDCSPIADAGLALAVNEVVTVSCDRPVVLYVSKSVRVPMATGFFKPMIVIPEWVVQEFSPDQLKVVVLHEAAHLQRRDDWTNLAQKVMRALFFFHPVVWWVEGRLALEREMACDDLVVARTSSPRAYAQCLVALAEKSVGRRNIAFAQAAVNRMRHTSMRIRQILDGKRVGTARVWKPAISLTVASAMACFAFSNAVPKLVSFQNPGEPGSPVALAALSASMPVPNELTGPRMSQAPALHIHRSGNSRSINAQIANNAPMPTQGNTPLPRSGEAADQPTAEYLLQSANFMPPAGGMTELQLNVGDEAVPLIEQSNAGRILPAAETVFVVLQNQQLDAAGDEVLRVRVYQWTVFYPVVYPSNPQKTLNESI